MSCPFCGGTSTRVADSRNLGGEQNRRRECETCRKRWWTVEIPRDRLAKLERAVARSSLTSRRQPALSDSDRVAIEAALPIIERIMR